MHLTHLKHELAEVEDLAQNSDTTDISPSVFFSSSALWFTVFLEAF